MLYALCHPLGKRCLLFRKAVSNQVSSMMIDLCGNRYCWSNKALQSFVLSLKHTPSEEGSHHIYVTSAIQLGDALILRFYWPGLCLSPCASSNVYRSLLTMRSIVKCFRIVPTSMKCAARTLQAPEAMQTLLVAHSYLLALTPRKSLGTRCWCD